MVRFFVVGSVFYSLIWILLLRRQKVMLIAWFLRKNLIGNPHDDWVAARWLANSTKIRFSLKVASIDHSENK